MNHWLTHLIGAVRAARLDPSAEDIADALWLTLQVASLPQAAPPPAPPPEAEQAAPPAPVAVEAAPPAPEAVEAAPPMREPKRVPKPPPPRPPKQPPTPPKVRPKAPAQEVSVHLPQRRDAGPGERGKRFRSPTAPALPDALKLARALRPCMKRTPSRTRLIFDEAATVARIAEEGVWMPVLRPAPERWLNLHLVVDGGGSMGVWEQATRELARLFGWVGAFRRVEMWGLDAESSPPELRAGWHGGIGTGPVRHPRALVDPGGKALVVVLSDCVGAAWHDGGVARMVETWGRGGPVALIHVLPEYLWRRTALGTATPVRLHAWGPAVPNSRLRVLPAFDSPDAVPAATAPLPVVALDPSSLASWAGLVAGFHTSGTPGFVLEQEPIDATPPAVPESTPESRVAAFWQTASPLARKLGHRLAASPVISLPVLRLIRQTLPDARQIHEAEVLLGGLLYVEKKTGEEETGEQENPTTGSEAIRYQFFDGVRALLLDSLPAADAHAVLEEVFEKVGRYIEDHIEQGLTFQAMLADPSAAAGRLSRDRTPFARIAADVLWRLGGDYARVVVPRTPSDAELALSSVDLSRIAQDLQIRRAQVEAVVQLLDEGNTVPFITRYRKEFTGGLDEELLRTIQERVAGLRQLAERKQNILRVIEGQWKLTDELREAIVHADHPKRLEDLYIPYKPKKRSLAADAREKGLESLAQAVWNPALGIAETPERLAEVVHTLVNPEKGLNTPDEVMQGVGHILAELIADTAEVRADVRHVLWDTGTLRTARSDKLAEGHGLEYKNYFDYAEALRQIPPHRILAINRGEKENALTARIEWDAASGRRAALEQLPLARTDETGPVKPNRPQDPRRRMPPVNRFGDLQKHPHRGFIERCADDALDRLLVPVLEREARRELTQRADGHAVSIFARNLRSKLLAAPLRGKRVLAIDPAFRTGCKVAVLSETGEPLAEAVVFPHQTPSKKAAEPSESGEPPAEVVVPQSPQNKRAEAKATLEELIRRHRIDVVAIGNGTACRETEELISELILDLDRRRDDPPAVPSEPVSSEPLPEAVPELGYVIVNEAGASVYSASAIGREELPQYEAGQRSTISIGRRLQDPLHELVKTEPQHVGVGLYQHDVNAKHLRESLDSVIESCVNTVGVDLNTASISLLRHVSGMNLLTAQNVVEFRNQNGLFRSREQLLQVPGIGEGRYVQAAGFLEITGGDEPLDGTWIHPESYPAARQILAELGCDPGVLHEHNKLSALRGKLEAMASEELADRLQVGLPTLRDIVNALAWPGRDPREDLPPPRIKKKILEFEALQVDTELEGTVLNVVDFGAFVDIGLKESGLVHISQLANRYVKSPYDVVSVGDVVSVWVLSVDKERKRVALTMIPPGTKPTRPQPGKKPLWTQSGGTRSSGGGKKQPGDTHPQKPPRTPQPGGSGLRPQPRPQAPPPAGTPQTEGQPSAAPPPRPARTPPRRPAPPPKPQGAPPGKHKKPMSTFGELAALLDERSRDQAAPPPEAQPPSGPRSQAEDAGDESARAERPGPPAEGTPPA